MKHFKFKKFLIRGIIPFLAFLLIIPQDLAAKQRTEVTAYRSNEKTVVGTLLSVDVNAKSITLEKNGEGTKLYTDEIDLIKIHKKGVLGKSVGSGVAVGAILGLGGGVIINASLDNFEKPPAGAVIGVGVVTFAIIGSLVGLLVGGLKSTYTGIRLKGKSAEEITNILQNLKKKAVLSD